MKKLMGLVLFASLFLSACGASGNSALPTMIQATPTATPSAGEIALQMMQKQMESQATLQAVGLQFTATAAVVGQTATAEKSALDAAQTQQARNDAIATGLKSEQNVIATDQQRRADVAATQQVIEIERTQSANATATFVVMTLSAVPTSAALTQKANEQEIALADLDVKKRMQTNTLDWMVKYGVIIGAFFTGVIVALRWSRTREVRNDDGEVQALIIDNRQVISPALLPGAVLDVEAMEMPPLTTPENEREIKKREQTISALKAIPVEPAKNAVALFGDVFNNKKPDEAFEIIEGETLPPAALLDSEALKSLEKDWEAANEK